LNTLIVYTLSDSPKLEYVLGFLCYKFLYCNYEITNDRNYFLEAKEVLKLNYSQDLMGDVITIPQSEYFKNFEIKQIPGIEEELNFNNDQGSFDIFAAAFYLLARVEEYGSFEKDAHGRFSSNKSILFKKDLLEKPVVDYWFCKLQKELESKYKLELITDSKFEFKSTVDIDHIYAYAEKPLFVRAGSFFRDLISLNLQRLKDRFLKTDPYDSFEFIIALHKKLNLPLQSFILTAKRGHFDKSFDCSHPSFINKISTLAKFGNVGIHPSYASNYIPAKIENEKSDLEKVINLKVTSSRQHFVRLEFPKTYKSLLKVGIKDDFSMGYPDRSGFRAGTSKAFRWYDLDEDKTTSLKVHSFQLMDVTLKNYEKLSKQAALDKSEVIIENTKKVGGTVCLIWHNSSFYNTEGWSGWQEVYEKILSMANLKNNNTLDSK